MPGHSRGTRDNENTPVIDGLSAAAINRRILSHALVVILVTRRSELRVNRTLGRDIAKHSSRASRKAPGKLSGMRYASIYDRVAQASTRKRSLRAKSINAGGRYA